MTQPTKGIFKIDSLSEFVGYFHALCVGLAADSHPEKSVGSGTVVMQIRDVESLGVQDGDTARSQTVSQSFEFG